MYKPFTFHIKDSFCTINWLLFVMLFCLINNKVYAQKYLLSSPDQSGQIEIEFVNDSISYSFDKNGIPVVNKSLLGIELNELNWKDLFVKAVKKDSVRSSWTPLWGTQRMYPDNYNSMVLEFQNYDSEASITILFRLYNEGLAFQYEVVSNGIKTLSIKKERTEFNISTSSKSWMLNHPWGKKYKKDVPINEIKNASLPLLSKTVNGIYILITEAQLYNYGSLHLSTDTKGKLSAVLVGDVILQSHFITPWRVIMDADSPVYFVEHNYLIQNLNPPSKIKNTAWIKPGISTWDWRTRGAKEGDFEYKLNTKSMLRFIDKTAELGLPYFMIDAGWYGAEHDKASNPIKPILEVDMQAIVKRTKEKNIGLWLYINRVAFEEHDIDSLFSTYKEWGVVGLKLGFLREQNQWGVEFLQMVLEKCAEYELMFNCHECVVPSGIERTWPHFLTREYNHSLMDGRYVASPIDHTITPFLNNIAGPIDVTPGFFDIDKMRERTFIKDELKSTVVAQGALSIVYFSPLLCLPDIPEAYQRKPDLFEFIRNLPLSYDETKVLVGDIGETYVVARRKSNTWWIGGVTNEEGTSIEIPLHFLKKGEYLVTIFTDGDNTSWNTNREEYFKEVKHLQSEDVLKLKLAPGGGVCVKLESIN